MDKNTVREALLEHAQTLIMTRGYNGFSYRDLSELVGVKTSSIHYYFPAKEDLALEAVNAYSADVMSSVYAIDSSAAADKNSIDTRSCLGAFSATGSKCACAACFRRISIRYPKRFVKPCRVFSRRTRIGWRKCSRKVKRKTRSMRVASQKRRRAPYMPHFKAVCLLAGCFKRAPDWTKLSTLSDGR